MQDGEAGALRRGLGGLPLTPRIKCIPQVQWRRGGGDTDVIAEVPQGPPSPNVLGGGGGIPRPQASPIPRIGRAGPDRRPGFCPSRWSRPAGWQARRRGRRERLPESFPARSSVQRGLLGGPTRAQPWSPNLVTAQCAKPCVVGTPRGGHFGQLYVGAPRQITAGVPGAGWGSLHAGVGERGGQSHRPHPLRRLLGTAGGLQPPGPARPGPACRPVGELGGEGGRTSRRCPSLRG